MSAAQNSMPVSMPRSCTDVEPGDRERLAEAGALGAGVDADDVDLAEARVVLVGVVHLQPVEADERIVAVVEREQEQRRVEPGFGDRGGPGVRGPAALLGVAGERLGC